VSQKRFKNFCITTYATHTHCNMPRLHQESFSSLSVLDWIEADSLNNALQLASSASDGVKNCGQKSFDEKERASLNVVDEEVIAMISAWKACGLSRSEDSSETWDSSDRTDDAASKSDIFEPLRRMPNPTPPKLFIRSSKRTTIRRNLHNTIQDGPERNQSHA
jgi:hypothetical protein